MLLYYFLLALCSVTISLKGSYKIRGVSIKRTHLSSMSTSSIDTTLTTVNVPSKTWSSITSFKEDIVEGVFEILEKYSTSSSTNSYSAGILVLSSQYDLNKAQDALNMIKQSIPSIEVVIGCTGGGVIGSNGNINVEPVESENRAGIALTLLSSDKVSTFRLTDDEVKQRSTQSSSSTSQELTHDALSFIFSTSSSKQHISKYIESISTTDSNPYGTIVGAIASSVTALHAPKLFLATSSSEDKNTLQFEKYIDGLVGLTIKPSTSINSDNKGSQIYVNKVIARSTLPVGPVYKIESRKDGEILSVLKEGEENTGSEEMSVENKSPLVRLDEVLKALTGEQADALKRELLIAISSTPDMKDYTTQRPTDFNPLQGSIILPQISSTDQYMQFVIKDAATARRNLLSANSQLKAILKSIQDAQNSIKSVMIFSNEDRGTKVFRYKSWESVQIFRQLQLLNVQNSPVFGLFSSGAYLSIPGDKVSLIETDAVYAVISEGPNKPQEVSMSTDKKGDDDASSSQISPDVLSTLEAEIYNDWNDGVIVAKKDTLSSHAVRVSTMEFGVPEKAPQPSNTLESLTWDRDKDLDRMRERFPATRALVLAKQSEKKYPPRSLLTAVLDMKKTTNKPAVIYCVHRNSVNGRKVSDDVNTIHLFVDTLNTAKECNLPLVSTGLHADSSTFKGQYEDLSLSRDMNTLPIFCDDFVQYAYQFCRAREHGADVVRLHASILTPSELTYLLKTAKAIGMATIITCASKKQVLDVLQQVPNMQFLSITSRNMRLWKIDQGKATSLYQDPEIQAAIKQYNEGKEQPLLLVQEGFSSVQDLSDAAKTGIDVIILGEETLQLSSSNDVNELSREGYEAALKTWFQPLSSSTSSSSS